MPLRVNAPARSHNLFVPETACANRIPKDEKHHGARNSDRVAPGWLRIGSFDGSHRHYFHEATMRKVTVSWHGSGRTFRIAILRRIIEVQARWTESDLIRLGLIRD